MINVFAFLFLLFGHAYAQKLHIVRRGDYEVSRLIGGYYVESYRMNEIRFFSNYTYSSADTSSIFIATVVGYKFYDKNNKMIFMTGGRLVTLPLEFILRKKIVYFRIVNEMQTSRKFYLPDSSHYGTYFFFFR